MKRLSGLIIVVCLFLLGGLVYYLYLQPDVAKLTITERDVVDTDDLATDFEVAWDEQDVDPRRDRHKGFRDESIRMPATHHPFRIDAGETESEALILKDSAVSPRVQLRHEETPSEALEQPMDVAPDSGHLRDKQTDAPEKSSWLGRLVAPLVSGRRSPRPAPRDTTQPTARTPTRDARPRPSAAIPMPPRYSRVLNQLKEQPYGTPVENPIPGSNIASITRFPADGSTLGAGVRHGSDEGDIYQIKTIPPSDRDDDDAGSAEIDRAGDEPKRDVSSEAFQFRESDEEDAVGTVDSASGSVSGDERIDEYKGPEVECGLFFADTFGEAVEDERGFFESCRVLIRLRGE